MQRQQLGLLGVVSGVAVGIAAMPVLPITLIVAILAFGLLSILSPFVSLILLLVIAPMRVLIATEAPAQIPSDVGQIALVTTVGFWLLHQLIKHRRLPQLQLSLLVVPTSLFTLALFLTGLSAFSTMSWLQETIKWLQIVFLIVFVIALFKDRSPQWLIFGLAIAGVAHALVGIYQFFGGSGALHLLINGQYFRAFGTFGQPNPFGGFMGLLTPVLVMAALGQAWRTWILWKNQQLSWNAGLMLIFYSAAAALVASGVVISWSRGAWLGFIASMGVIALSIPTKLWQSAVLFFLGICFLGTAWYTDLIPQPIASRLNSIQFDSADVRGVQITTANYANVERLAHWQAAVRMAQANPWLGVGAGNYEVAYDDHRLIDWQEPLGHAHNYYLNVLAEAGIIGFIVYIAMWVSIIIISWRSRQHPDAFSRCVAIGLLGSWGYLTVHSMTDNLYVNNIFIYIGVMLGLLAVIHRQAHGFTQLEY